VNPRLTPPAADVQRVNQSTQASLLERLAVRLAGVVALLQGLSITYFAACAYVIPAAQPQASPAFLASRFLLGVFVVALGIGIFRLKQWAAILWAVLTFFMAAVGLIASSLSPGSSNPTGRWALLGVALVCVWLVERENLRRLPNPSIERTA
jgi:peptidoglycan/LPS O-acetylase OafA/YrhL